MLSIDPVQRSAQPVRTAHRDVAMSLTDLLGYVAAFCTTAAYAPQVVKVWKPRRTNDISLKAFCVLVTGQSLWLAYGVAKGDWPLMGSNGVTLTFTSTILYFKYREWRGDQEEGNLREPDSERA